MVVNSIVMAMMANANKHCLKIYHVGSSLRNPLPFRKLLDINYQYFSNNPWIDGQGMLVKISKAILVKRRLHSQILFLLFIIVFMVICSSSQIKFNVRYLFYSISWSKVGHQAFVTLTFFFCLFYCRF